MDKTRHNQEKERRHREYELKAKEILEGKGKLTNLIYLTVTSLLLIGITSVWFYIEFNPEWMRYQKKYEPISKEVLGDKWQKRKKRIEQVVVDKLNRVDRCPTCHLGMENEEFKNVEQPFKLHSGKYLDWHPVENFGCTICHRGNG